MAVNSDNPLQAVIAPSMLAADLVIPALLSREAITKEACIAALQRSGVEVTPTVTQAVEALVAAPPAAGRENRVRVAGAAMPPAGEDEQIQWLVNGAADAGAGPAADGDPYVRYAGIPVKIGQVLARIKPATAGRCGRTVTGQSIPAIAGRPLNLKLPSGIVRDGDGQLIAQIDGVLRRTPGLAAVFQQLSARELAESAASITYKGDVLAPAIHDGATVKCTGTVESAGAIGAANIDCGGDLLARGGMTGRGAGRIKIGGGVCAKYLDKVTGTIAGDLTIENELMNCDLTVGGSVRIVRGNIRGGTLIATGSILVNDLGTDRAATNVVLGTVPFHEPLTAQLRETKAKLEAHCNALVAEQQTIAKKEAKATAHERERQTEIMFELQSANQNLGRVMAGIDALEARIREKRTVDLRVTRRCAAGVVLIIDGQSYAMREAINGPFQIKLDEKGQPQVVREGAPPRSLSELTRPARAAA